MRRYVIVPAVVAVLLLAGAVAQPAMDEGDGMRVGGVALPAWPFGNPAEDEDERLVDAPSVPADGGIVGLGWPTEGSFVHYTAHGVALARNTLSETWQNATWTFHLGRWYVACEHEYNETRDHGRGRVSSDSGGEVKVLALEADADAPPFVEESSRRTRAWTMEECDKPKRLSVGEATPTTLHWAGDGNVTAHYATAGTYRGAPRAEAWWDPETGVLLGWRSQERGGMTEGRLVVTDAPLGMTSAPAGTSPGNATMAGGDEAMAMPSGGMPSATSSIMPSAGVPGGVMPMSDPDDFWS